MFLKKSSVPVLFAAFGGLGYFIRKAELKVAYEPVSGLFAKWNMMTVLTAVLALGVAALAVYIALGYKRAGSTPEQMPSLRWGMGHFVVGLIAAVLFGAGAYSFYSGLWYSTFEIPWLEKLLVVLAVASAVAVAVCCCCVSNPKPGIVTKIACCIPPLFLCIWLLYFYRVNAVNPALAAFVWQCLGLAFAAMGTFYFAGYFHGTRKTARTVWCLLVGEYLCIVSLADQTALDGLLLLSGTALWLAVLASATVGGAQDNT